jgi:hypothetical protein
MARKRSTYNIDPEVDELLDCIARAMEDSLRPAPSKSGLVNKALLLYIEECKKEDGLRAVIEDIQARQAQARAAQKVVRIESRRGKTKRAVGARKVKGGRKSNRGG